MPWDILNIIHKFDGECIDYISYTTFLQHSPH